MKKYILLLLLLSIQQSVYAARSSNQLAGTYDCTSEEVGTHEKYTGIMLVTKTGDTYGVSSTFNDGSKYTGTGIYDTHKHNFSVVFINPKNPSETGLGMADVKKNYDMKSTWTYLNNTTLGYAKCTKRV